MALFEALYCRKCMTPLCWSNMEEKRNLGPDLVHEIEDKVKLICERLKVGNKVFLKVLPWKKVLRFGQKGKLSSMFIALTRLDHSHILPVEEIEVRSELLYEEQPVTILDREFNVLCSKTILLVKFLWRNCKTEEATWKPEDITRR
ncbi:uncharacterized protein [Gossypium hirsutum]|uniref:Uncharacterized protein n=1 Tax=Gossypium hirsutum TaxID=3635 RepID=A0A1U8MTX7_GOSHI|nr:uncharacterized protein LOC107941242 [Gossypium hirsutum]